MAVAAAAVSASRAPFTSETLRSAAKQSEGIHLTPAPSAAPSKNFSEMNRRAMREVWPRSWQQVNLVEPSKEMQRAAQSLLRDDQFGLMKKVKLKTVSFPTLLMLRRPTCFTSYDEDEVEEDHADLGVRWGRIIYTPLRRGRQIRMDVCGSTKRDGHPE